MADYGRFVRVPTGLLEALLRAGLGGGQYRVVLWVIRNTYGWNRAFTSFSWYRVAKDVQMDRSAVYRAGLLLLNERVLAVRDKQLGVCPDFGETAVKLATDARVHEKALPGNNAEVVGMQPFRCQTTPPLRRAKDSSKDTTKTYKENLEGENSKGPSLRDRPNTARPTTLRKYGRLSEN